MRGENRSTRRKTSRSRVENQQTQPTYDADSRNRTRATLVGGERSTTAPTLLPWYFIGVCIISRILHAHLGIRILCSRVQLDISLERCAHS